jgi:predicted RNA-binding protein YlqC (UPF0109 family)
LGEDKLQEAVIGSLSSEAQVAKITYVVFAVVTALVDEPDAVAILPEDVGNRLILTVYVAPKDLGKVVGKQGRTARSIRSVLHAVSSKLQRHVDLDIRARETTTL